MKALFKARVDHKRFLPKSNAFSYSGFYIKFSLEKMDELKSRFFGLNTFNFFSFYEKDHGYRDERSLYKWAQDILNVSGIKDFNGSITLQTLPRVCGYVFNPVSFWYCYGPDKLVAVICEVNNTFGESHNYVLTQNPAESVQYLKKHFHVSPFYAIEGGYYFDFRHSDKVSINYHFDNRLQLSTSICGSEIEFTDSNLIKLFLKQPFYTLLVMVLIHYQALKLFIKRITFYSKPEKEKQEVTYE